MFGLISARPPTIKNDRELWCFDPKAARCAETSVGVVQWQKPDLAIQQDFHIPYQRFNTEWGGNREAREQSFTFLHEGAL